MLEPRTNLELLILTLISRNLGTPYDLHTRAGISVGAAIPALKRLEKDGLIEGTSGSRRSRRFALTKSGRRSLESELQNLGRELPGDFESILRVAYLLWLSKSPRAFREFLKRAAAERLHLAQAAKAESATLIAGSLPLDEGHGHRWMKALTNADRFRAEALALNHVAAKVPRSH